VRRIGELDEANVVVSDLLRLRELSILEQAAIVLRRVGAASGDVRDDDLADALAVNGRRRETMVTATATRIVTARNAPLDPLFFAKPLRLSRLIGSAHLLSDKSSLLRFLPTSSLWVEQAHGTPRKTFFQFIPYYRQGFS